MLPLLLCCGNRSSKFPLCEAFVKFDAILVNICAWFESLVFLAASVSCWAMLAVIFLNSVGFDLLSCSSSLNSLPGSETLLESLVEAVEVAEEVEEVEVEVVLVLDALCKSCQRSSEDDDVI